MNRANLKSYAPKARKDFLRAVSDRARKVGLTIGHSEPVEVRGDVAIISGQAFPKRVADQRRRLDEHIKRNGFTAVMEEAAYTWFNRFMALRYMEVHGYLEHGYRVLSDPNGKDRPQILEQAENVTLPGVDKGVVIGLKLNGTKDEELYKLLLLGQCHALHLAMPFLFERIDDQTELLLPDNLLASDSVVRKMVTEIAEADWERVEIIGWLYQFYITEEKARIDSDLKAGKAVANRDIPAKTQLFTPNWIVKYMVQNSLGRQWLGTYPQSPLRGQMDFYIEPAEQTEDVKAELAAITPREIDPEALKLIDPACGSGHILVEAYDVFKEIYLERGYRLRDIPRLILEKNLFGLEIDDRAAQMAGFALLMKARADDRRLLDQTPLLNVRAIQSSEGLNPSQLANDMLVPNRAELMTNNELFPETNPQPSLANELFPETNPQPSLATVEEFFIRPHDLAALCTLFADAKTVGSLLTIPTDIATSLDRLANALLLASRGDLLARSAATYLIPLVAQAKILAQQYDISITNPPYLGSKGMNADMKGFATKNFNSSKSDLFAMFIVRGLSLVKLGGYCAMVTMESWMFLSSYASLREHLLAEIFVQNLVHMPYEGKQPTAMGINFGVSSFCLRKLPYENYSGSYSRLRHIDLQSDGIPLSSDYITKPPYSAMASELKMIPGVPIAYWISDRTRNIFHEAPQLESSSPVRQGFQTGNNGRFIRFWFEVAYNKVLFSASKADDITVAGKKWVPYNKGGDFRKWYGNNEYLVAFDRANYDLLKVSGNCLPSRDLYFLESITYTALSSGFFGARYSPPGFTFSAKGACTFPSREKMEMILALLNSKVSAKMLEFLAATMDFNVGSVRKIPVQDVDALGSERIISGTVRAIQIAQEDWNSDERSWEFRSLPLLDNSPTIEQAYIQWQDHCKSRRQEMQEIEIENNRIFIQAYGLGREITPEVDSNQITLKLADRQRDVEKLISFAIGCMMGRYSLDRPGLIYAHSNNESFHPDRYTTYTADSDGILPITDTDWFGAEDTANRFGDFLKVAWPAEAYHENVQFIAESLSLKTGESPMDTIRRYLATAFFNDHLQTYKKRPIYWLFSSGKERAFQALVYLHRYNEGTLARMRMDYVVPLQSRLSARIEQLDKDITDSTSTAERKKRQNERDKLSRQYLELIAFDEKLRHYADQRIGLDLDDGVKVNYAKFGDLLAEVKAVTGDKDE